MGEYYKAVNLDKKEYVMPHELGSGAKLYEFCVNRGAGAILYLLDGYGGSWAGDRIILVGDYDLSGLYQKTDEDPEYTDVSTRARDEYNEFLSGSLIGPLKPLEGSGKG